MQDFFSVLYLRSHFRQVEMWGLVRGQESNWCRAAGGRVLYSTPATHTSHAGSGAGPRGLQGPGFYICSESIRKMQSTLYDHCQGEPSVTINWQCNNVSTMQQPCEICAPWGGPRRIRRGEKPFMALKGYWTFLSYRICLCVYCFLTCPVDTGKDLECKKYFTCIMHFLFVS